MTRKKKILVIVLSCIAGFLSFFSSAIMSCVFSNIFKSVDPSKPEDGVWYCEEKSIMIDFGTSEGGWPYCDAIRYITDDKQYYVPVVHYTDFGSNVITIESGDADHIVFIRGECDYSDGTFTIHDREKNKDYVFTRTQYKSIKEATAKSKMY